MTFFPKEYHSSLVFAITGTGLFSISKYAGQLSVRKPAIDFEESTLFNIHVTATYMGNRSQTLDVVVRVDDVIDETPSFLQDLYSIVVPHSTPVGTKLLQLEIHDRDVGDSHRVSVLMSHPAEGELLFEIDRSTQSLVLKRAMSHSSVGRYELLVLAQDRANLTAEALITVAVVDSTFVKMVDEHVETFFVDESSLPDRALADLSSNGAMFCSIISSDSDSFLVRSSPPSLWLVRELDYEYTEICELDSSV